MSQTAVAQLVGNGSVKPSGMDSWRLLLAHVLDSGGKIEVSEVALDSMSHEDLLNAKLAWTKIPGGESLVVYIKKPPGGP